MIGTESATVYRGGGRRYLTKRAAFLAEARAKIKTRCECDRGDYDGITPPYVCHYHCDLDRLNRMVRRLARIYGTAYSAAQSHLTGAAQRSRHEAGKDKGEA